MTDKNGQSIEVSYIFTDTIDDKSDGKLCLKICNSCNQNDSSTHEYKIDHQQLKNHIRQLEEWALLEKFYDNNAYYSKRTKQLEKKIADAGFITRKVKAENFNVKEFKDDIASMLCEQPPCVHTRFLHPDTYLPINCTNSIRQIWKTRREI